MYDGGVVEGRIDLNRWVEIASTAPAKIFGMFPKKGTIAPGSDADIVVFNPDGETLISAETHHMNVDYSCYEGRKLKGAVETVLSRGDVIIEDDRFTSQPGRGQYVQRSPRS